MANIIVITDLDGTLLHPRTYSFDEARPALELLRERGIPLILCSSKTRAEIEVYRQRLKNKHPFISENGGGIFIPEGYFKVYSLPSLLKEEPIPSPSPLKGEDQGEGDKKGYKCITLGRPYNDIRRVFLETRERLGVKARGFGDMDAKEISVLAGLPLEEAILAKKRDFDEPFIFEEEPPSPPLSPLLSKEGMGEVKGGSRGVVEEFLKAIEVAGLHWTQGRFYHILGDNDKGKAAKITKGLYENAYGRIKTIGLGNSFNDLPLLLEVDYPVLVQNEDGSYDNRISLPNLIKVDGVGPEGWNKAIMGLIR